MATKEPLKYWEYDNPMISEAGTPSAKTIKACEQRRADRAKIPGTAHHAFAQKGVAAKAEADAKKKADADLKKKADAEAKKKAADLKKKEADAAKKKAAADELAAALAHPALVNACTHCKVAASELCVTGGDNPKPRLDPHKDRKDALGN